MSSQIKSDSKLKCVSNSNSKQVQKLKQKSVIQQLNSARSTRLSSKTINDSDLANNFNNNENLNNLVDNSLIFQSEIKSEDKKERIILKLNLKNFNINPDNMSSKKRKNSSSSDEKLNEKTNRHLNINKKYLKNELDDTLNHNSLQDYVNIGTNNATSVRLDDQEEDDANIISAAASAMMQLSNTTY